MVETEEELSGCPTLAASLYLPLGWAGKIEFSILFR